MVYFFRFRIARRRFRSAFASRSTSTFGTVMIRRMAWAKRSYSVVGLASLIAAASSRAYAGVVAGSPIRCS